jgi:hypothetical protein
MIASILLSESVVGINPFSFCCHGVCLLGLYGTYTMTYVGSEWFGIRILQLNNGLWVRYKLYTVVCLYGSTVVNALKDGN